MLVFPLLCVRTNINNLFPAPSAHSFAPFASEAPQLDDYSGPLPHGNDVVIMTGLQIAMSRELFGWPLYTIIIALGQVCFISHHRSDSMYSNNS